MRRIESPSFMPLAQSKARCSTLPAHHILFMATGALLVLATVVHALFGYTHPQMSGHAWGTDDAYISYRYARNFTEGYGLVFNPGERVEGYSNLSYVLTMALLIRLFGLDLLYPMSVAFNIGCLVAAALLTVTHIASKHGSGTRPLVAVLLVCCPPLWLWAASGLETPLVLLLQVALWIVSNRIILYNGTRDRVWLAGLIGMLVLSRADGFVWPALVLFYLVLQRRWAAVRWGGASLVVVMGVLVAWRLAYYGYPLPNTYYAKVDGTLQQRFVHALQQLWDILIADGVWPYLLLALGSVLATLRKGIRNAVAHLPFEGVAIAGWVAYWLYVGGDEFYERFLIVLFPLGIALLMKVCASTTRVRTTLLVAILVLLQLQPLLNDTRYSYTTAKYDMWLSLGQVLRDNHAGATLAIDAAGKVPFVSNLETIDMLGLNDAHIGHRQMPAGGVFRPGHTKHDVQYVLGRKPTLIAAWIDPDRAGTLDMTADLGETTYTAAGYRLRYLVNTQQQSRGVGQDVLDVRGWDRDRVHAVIERGYDYAVIAR